MAEQLRSPMSLSPRFDENYSGQHAPYTNAYGFHLPPQHSGLYPNQQAGSSFSKRSRGRPPGAKNKPKPPIVIIKDNNYDVKPVIIEVGAGFDVVEEVIQLARRHHAGIMVVHAAGIISNVTLCHPLGQVPASFTLHGPFPLLGLYGSYLTPLSLDACFPSSSQPSFIPNLPPSAIRSTFGICLSGFQGNVIGGVVAGKVMAANYGVIVTALLFKNPEYHSVGVVTEGEIEEEDIDYPLDGDGAYGDHIGASGFGGNGASGFGMPVFSQD